MQGKEARASPAGRRRDRTKRTHAHTYNRPIWLKGKVFFRKAVGGLGLVSMGPGMPKKLSYSNEEGQDRD